jgi:hypothetical protein
MSRSRSLLATACVCVLLLVTGAGAAHAQAILDGKITGSVTTEDKTPLPGATVEISSPALLGGKQTTTATAKGTYVFLNVPVGTYRVTVSLDTFKTVVFDSVDVSAASVVTIDAVLTAGTVTETVSVTAESALVDTKTSTIDSKLGKDMLERLPTSRDAFYDLATTTPGMFDVGNSSGWLPSPTAYGGSGNENVFLVNGVNTTNPRGAQFGSLVKVNYDTVEEVRVVALGSKAEYGSYSGAAIDVLTRSGSNDYHGSVAFYSKLGNPANNQPGPGADLGRDWLYIGEGEQLAGETKSDWEANFTLGGPIMRDKVWFFGAFDYVYNKSLPPRWSLQNTYKGRYADAKISAQPFTNHRAWVAYHYENNKGDGWSWGSEPEWDTSMTYGVGSVNNTVSAQWQYFPASTAVLSAKYLGFWTDDQPFVPGDAPDHPGYINWWKWSQYGVNGAFPYVEAQKSNRQTIQGDVSYYAEDFLGQHDMKFGVQYTKGRGNWEGGYFQNYVNFLYPYRWTQNVGYMQSWYGDTGLMFYNNKWTLNPFLTVRTADSFGVFFDDQWTPTRRLTINFGLRFDRMTTKYGTGKVYEFISTPEEINGPPPVVRDRRSTGNIFDFKTWSPRIGLSYMLTDDGKTVARASYGRYYLPMSVETLRRFGPDMPLTTQVQQFYMVGPWSSVDTNGDNFIDAIETRNAARQVYGQTPLWVSDPSTIDQSWMLNVADGVKDQFSDQFTLNVEREVTRDLSVSATYIYKHTGNIFVNIPINEVTGQEWEYERIPYTTAAGQTVQLYSVVYKDWNGDGEVNGADVRRHQAEARLPRAAAGAEQAVLQPVARPGVLRLLVLVGHRHPGDPAGQQHGRADGHGRQLDGLAQPDDQQHGHRSALHAQVRVQAVRIVPDPDHRDRRRAAVAPPQRQAPLAAGGLPPAHPVGGTRGWRHRHGRREHRGRHGARLPADPQPPGPPAREAVQARRVDVAQPGRRRFQHLQLRDGDPGRLPVGVRQDHGHPGAPALPGQRATQLLAVS